MADYIPSNEAAKLLWLWNLAMWLWRDNALNGLLHGFSIHEVNIFRFTVVQAKQAAKTTVDKEAGGGSPRLSGCRARGGPCTQGGRPGPGHPGK